MPDVLWETTWSRTSELQGSMASPSEVSAARGPMGWLFAAAFGCSGATTEKKR